MSKQRQKGTRHETALVEYLKANGFPDARREVLHGARDVGDIGGITWQGKPVVIEAKDHQTQRPKAWLEEAEAERVNAGADIAAVVAHRKGCGKARFGENDVFIELRHVARLLGTETNQEGYVTMRLDMFIGLLKGEETYAEEVRCWQVRLHREAHCRL